MAYEAPTQEQFAPVPASVNPYLALDPEYVERLVQSRSLCPEKRDPFLADEQARAN